MNIYLPGQSVKNREELLYFVDKFSDSGIDLMTHEYSNWVNEEKEFNLEDELQSLQTKIPLINNDFNLICKSIGTSVGVNFFTRYLKGKVLSHLILMGIPSQSAEPFLSSYWEAISAAQKCMIILNENDPYVDFHQIDQITKAQEVILKIIPNNDTHKYFYPDEVMEFLSSN